MAEGAPCLASINTSRQFMRSDRDIQLDTAQCCFTAQRLCDIFEHQFDLSIFERERERLFVLTRNLQMIVEQVAHAATILYGVRQKLAVFHVERLARLQLTLEKL